MKANEFDILQYFAVLLSYGVSREIDGIGRADTKGYKEQGSFKTDSPGPYLHCADPSH